LKKLSFIFGVILTHCVPCFGAGHVENQSIVCLQTDFSRGKSKIGTGFFISPTLIATASHQVTDPGAVTVKITAYLHDKTSVEAKLPVFAQGDGVAILAVPDAVKSNYLLMQNNAQNDAAKIFTIGCQKDRSRLREEGEVLQRRNNDEQSDKFTDLIPLNLAIKVGFSGGPLLSTNGDVVGVIYGFDEHSESLSYAIPISKLYQIMAGQKATEYSKMLYYQGIRAFSLKQHGVAKRYFEEAIQQKADYFEAYISLGMTLFKLGQFAEARDALHEAILLETDYPLAYYHLGGIYREGLSDLRSARNAYRRYLELDPTSSDADQVRRWVEEIDRSLTN
jgi:tetratricopeptide (TPR) repeat protein